MDDINGGEVLLKVQIGHLDPEDLSLDQMQALYRKYGDTWWKDKRFNFRSDPLMFNNSDFDIRKTQW